MNEQWQNFLQQNGATVDNGMVSSFTNKAFDFQHIDQETVLVDLSHRNLVKASGTDSKDFLQGQFCNDVANVDDSHSQLSAYCTPKGRILASFHLFQADADYFLSIPADVVEATLKRLRMFIMRSQVTLDDVTNEQIQIGISGPEAAKILEKELGNVPTTANEVVSHNKVRCIRIASEIPRFELYGPIDDIKHLWQALSTSCQSVASHYWTWLDIRDGIPSVTAPVVEAFVPQMINLQWIDGLSFKKGCYPGQEIVARTHYLGKLKRRMYLGHVDSPACPAAGDELHSSADPQGQSAGKVLLSHPAPQGGCDILAVMKIDAVESGEIIANRDTQLKLRFSKLPYSIETAE